MPSRFNGSKAHYLSFIVNRNGAGGSSVSSHLVVPASSSPTVESGSGALCLRCASATMFRHSAGVTRSRHISTSRSPRFGRFSAAPSLPRIRQSRRVRTGLARHGSYSNGTIGEMHRSCGVPYRNCGGTPGDYFRMRRCCGSPPRIVPVRCAVKGRVWTGMLPAKPLSQWHDFHIVLPQGLALTKALAGEPSQQ
jgi:hypothetical protein